MIWMTMALAGMLSVEAKPEGLGVSTWVREDLFAGPLAGDMVRLEKGMAKVEALLAANPRSGETLAWRAFGHLCLAVFALEAGQKDSFEKWHRLAQADFQKARQAAGPEEMGALHAVTGGTYAVLADRLPPALRRDGWLAVRENYTALRESQKSVFDKLPVHFRGEILAGLAQAEQRLGETSQTALNELIATLPDSVYAKRAQTWKEKPEVAAKTALACQTCHDPGRLDNVLAKRPPSK